MEHYLDPNHHLPRTLEGDLGPLSLLTSSSNSLPSTTQKPLLLTLNSELALLLVARGESETLIVLLRVGPDRTLYIDDAGIFVINGLKLPGMCRLISCSRKYTMGNMKHVEFVSKMKTRSSHIIYSWK